MNRKWICGLLMTVTASSGFVARAADGLTFLGGAGQAIRQPGGLVVVVPCPSAAPVGNNHFLASLDLTDDGQTFYSATIDRLSSGDVANGLASDLGRFDQLSAASQCFQLDKFTGTWTSSGPASLTGATTFSYAVLATVAWAVSDGADPFEEQPLSLIGSKPVPFAETVLLDQTFQYPVGGPAEDSVKVKVTLKTTGKIEVKLSSITGTDALLVSGDFLWELVGGDVDNVLTHTVTGVTIGPEGAIYVLTEAGTELTGLPTLYTVTPQPSDTLPTLDMTPVAAIEVDDPEALWSIEFAPDGTLFAAGQDLFALDLETGLAMLIGSPGVGLIVDLACTPQGDLYGVAHDDDGATRLYKLDTATGAANLVTSLPGETIWGLAVLPFDEGDLDHDGDIDDDDWNIYTEEYTGTLTEAVVPVGPGGTWISDPIIVPLSDFMDYPTLEDLHTTRIPLDGLDFVFPGIVTSGSPVERGDSSAFVHLAHDATYLYVGFDVIDDLLEGSTDYWELYLDSNNSDLEITEGDVFGFQALVRSDGTEGGDANALAAWESGGVLTLRGDGAQIRVKKADTGMVTGGTYGFDVAITESDGDDDTHYFLISTTEEGWRDERMWGNIKLAEGPLPPPAIEPIPVHFAPGVQADPLLSWTGSPEVHTFNVFVGNDPAVLVFQGTTKATTFGLTDLCKGWTYYWRVDAVGDNGIRTGTTWQFSTVYSVADLDRDGDVDLDDEAALPSNLADGDLDGIGSCHDNCPDLANTDQADCDGDGMGDVCAIAAGLTPDCNGNGVPDGCDIHPQFVADSGVLSPIGSGSPQSFLITSPPMAEEDVTLSFSAFADLNLTTEYIDVDINGLYIGSVFVAGGSDCPATPDLEDIVLSADMFNDAVAGGDALINMVSTADVSLTLCTSYISVKVQFGYTVGDTNSNGIPDKCEPSECDGDANRDGQVDPLDSGYVLSRFGCSVGTGRDDCDAADQNHDGTVDPLDVGYVLSRFGDCF